MNLSPPGWVQHILLRVSHPEQSSGSQMRLNVCSLAWLSIGSDSDGSMGFHEEKGANVPRELEHVSDQFLRGELQDGYQHPHVSSNVERKSDPVVSSMEACTEPSLFCLSTDYLTSPLKPQNRMLPPGYHPKGLDLTIPTASLLSSVTFGLPVLLMRTSSAPTWRLNPCFPHFANCQFSPA